MGHDLTLYPLSRTPRQLAFRVGAAFATLIFMMMGGAAGVESHPFSHSGPHSSDIVAIELGAHESASAGDRAGHHSGRPQHGSSQECTCIGACQSGAAPTLPNVLFSEALGGEIDRQRVARVATSPIHENPTAYLFPFPNAPPPQA